MCWNVSPVKGKKMAWHSDGRHCLGTCILLRWSLANRPTSLMGERTEAKYRSENFEVLNLWICIFRQLLGSRPIPQTEPRGVRHRRHSILVDRNRSDWTGFLQRPASLLDNAPRFRHSVVFLANGKSYSFIRPHRKYFFQILHPFGYRAWGTHLFAQHLTHTHRHGLTFPQEIDPRTLNKGIPMRKTIWTLWPKRVSA